MELYQKGQYKNARKHFEKYLETHPNDREIWGYLGNTWYFQGHRKEAEACFRKAVSAEPSPPFCRLALAELLQEEGRYREAIRVFRQILKESTEQLPARQGLRDSLIGLGRFSQAFRVNETLRSGHQKSWLEDYARAFLLLNDGKLLKAREQFEQLLADQPDLFAAKVELASIYFSLGEYRKAKPYLLSESIGEMEDLEFCVLRASYI
jgi:tetratricopeptide (TPR) repeat protein